MRKYLASALVVASLFAAGSAFAASTKATEPLGRVEFGVYVPEDGLDVEAGVYDNKDLVTIKGLKLYPRMGLSDSEEDVRGAKDTRSGLYWTKRVIKDDGTLDRTNVVVSTDAKLGFLTADDFDDFANRKFNSVITELAENAAAYKFAAFNATANQNDAITSSSVKVEKNGTVSVTLPLTEVFPLNATADDNTKTVSIRLGTVSEDARSLDLGVMVGRYVVSADTPAFKLYVTRKKGAPTAHVAGDSQYAINFALPVPEKGSYDTVDDPYDKAKRSEDGKAIIIPLQYDLTEKNVSGNSKLVGGDSKTERQNLRDLAEMCLDVMVFTPDSTWSIASVGDKGKIDTSLTIKTDTLPTDGSAKKVDLVIKASEKASSGFGSLKDKKTIRHYYPAKSLGNITSAGDGLPQWVVLNNDDGEVIPEVKTTFWVTKDKVYLVDPGKTPSTPGTTPAPETPTESPVSMNSESCENPEKAESSVADAVEADVKKSLGTAALADDAINVTVDVPTVDEKITIAEAVADPAKLGADYTAVESVATLDKAVLVNGNPSSYMVVELDNGKAPSIVKAMSLKGRFVGNVLTVGANAVNKPTLAVINKAGKATPLAFAYGFTATTLTYLPKGFFTVIDPEASVAGTASIAAAGENLDLYANVDGVADAPVTVATAAAAKDIKLPANVCSLVGEGATAPVATSAIVMKPVVDAAKVANEIKENASSSDKPSDKPSDEPSDNPSDTPSDNPDESTGSVGSSGGGCEVSPFRF